MRVLAIDTSCARGVGGGLRRRLARAARGARARPMTRGHAEALAPMVERGDARRRGRRGFARHDRGRDRAGLVHRHSRRLRDGAGDGARARHSRRRRFDADRLRRADARRAAPGVIAAAIDAGHGAVYFQLFDSGQPMFSPRVDSCATRARDRRRPGADRRRRRGDCSRARRGAPGCVEVDAARAALPDIVAIAASGSPPIPR